MRHLSLAAGLAALSLLASGCATMGTPPGGPADSTAPVITSIEPDSGAVNAPDRALVVRFDEVITDRPSGVTDLAGLVLISPRTGAPRVDWRRTSIAIRPRGGWRRNVTYTVTLLPGLADVRGNVLREPTRIVFATGPELATARVTGHIFDWVAARPVAGGIVEAIALPVGRDSIVYVGASDSSGTFTVGPLPAGSYVVRGFVDQNRNRALDRVELRDSLTVAAADDAPPIELLAALRDTVAPRISAVARRDSLTLELTVDRPLRRDQVLGTDRIRVVTSDSTPVAVASVQLRSTQELTARRDTAAAEVDTAAARADTAALVDTTRVPRRDSLPSSIGDTAGTDTVARAPQPSRPPPPTVVVLRFAEPLAAGTAYRITVLGLTSIMGARRDTERVFSTPRPPPATERAPSDTAPMPTRRAAPDPAPVRPDTLRVRPDSMPVRPDTIPVRPGGTRGPSRLRE